MAAATETFFLIFSVSQISSGLSGEVPHLAPMKTFSGCQEPFQQPSHVPYWGTSDINIARYKWSEVYALYALGVPILFETGNPFENMTKGGRTSHKMAAVEA